MTERIIDLRRQEASSQPTSRSDRKTLLPVPVASTEAKSRGKALIEWEAPEYPHHERSPHWWVVPAAGALLLVLLSILLKSYVFTAFVAISFAVVVLYARRPPRVYRFAISQEGVYIGETRHRWSELASFWIFEHDLGPELSLEITSGRIMTHLHLPLGDVHPNRIRRVVSDFLPEQEHKELVTDQIARSIGF